VRAQQGTPAVQDGVTTQQNGVAVSGTVEDGAGGVILEAKVTLTNKATGEVRATVTDDGGSFKFPSVAPGSYSLHSRASGFEPADLEISVGQTTLAAIKITLGIKLTEQVTITDNKEAQTLSAEANVDRIDLSSDFLRTLPAQSDEILPIIGNFLSTSSQGTEGLSVVVDGVEGTQLNVPTEAIRRVLINRNPYSSAYRRPGEGRVEIITKDGSRRRYDGTFSYMVRNAFFDARDTFTRRFALPNPNLDRRLFSASFGGPVLGWKKATFFFSANHLINHQDIGINAITGSGPLIENVPTTKNRLNLISRLDVRPNSVHTFTTRFYYYGGLETNKGLGLPLVLPEQGYDGQLSGERIMFADRAILSPALLNELSIDFSHDNVRDGGKPDRPALVVRGFFIGGPSQVDRKHNENLVNLRDAVTYTRGNHNLRFGGELRFRTINSVNATNFVGTYYFQGLFDYLDKSPASFRMGTGDPTIRFSQYEANGFIEDEWRVRPWLTITPGLRYDWQSSIKDYRNIGPRISFAFAPGRQKTVVRGGAGVFYERMSAAVLEQQSTNELEIVGPSYPNPTGGRPRPAQPPNTWTLATDLRAPYLLIGSLSLERRLWGRSQVSVEYFRLHGVHLFRARNVNASLDQFGPQFIGMRPNMNFRIINEVESSAASRSSELKATFQGSLGKIFRGMAQYRYSHTEDNTSGPLTLPANSYDLGPEWSRSSFDMRHRMSFVGTFELPFSLRMGAVLSIASGRPYDITTGYDDNADGVFTDRPLGGRRNTGLAPAIAQLDLRFTKLFNLPTPFPHKATKSDRKSKNFEFNIDAFNVFNHPNTPVIIGQLGAHLFGQATSANMSRTLQLSVKYSF
jgi:hypothetical protein